MKTLLWRSLLCCAFASTLFAESWPQWRGPNLNGVSGETNLPVRWSKTENIAWKLQLPPLSGSTPIVWEDRIFLSVAEKEDLYLWCVDRQNGSVLWKRLLGGGNMKTRKENMSSPSPVTDGRHVWIITGTGILKAFDMTGREAWSRDIPQDYGPFGLNFGYASSPLLHDGSLYVQVIHGMNTKQSSYLLRIDASTGKTMWRVDRPSTARDESKDAYTTPTLARHGAAVEIVVSGADVVTGYDPQTGSELWRVKGLNPDDDNGYRIVASPVAINDMIFAPSRQRPLLALQGGGRGDISNSHVLWSFAKGPDVPTPVSDGNYLYVVADNGVLTCLEVKTGREIYRQRMPSSTYTGSPILADGKIYVTNEDGLTVVVKAGPVFEILAENDLDDYTLSSPAVSGGQIFIRTNGFLYAIAARK
jgi:outer membrane protein assembly factor BamB